MSNNLSDSIVHFISGMPHFQLENLNGKIVARRITDGTMFFSPDEPESCEDGIIAAYWQGDEKRRTDNIRGTQLAELEVSEGIRIWVALGEYNDYKTAYAGMAQHFNIKTGETIAHCPIQENLFSHIAYFFRTCFK